MSGANNPFYTNQQLGAGISNLASAFMPNPQRDMHRAHADLYRTQADRLRGQMAGDAALADAYSTGLGADPAAGWRQIFAAGARTGNPAAIRALTEGAGVYGATQGIPESDLGRIVVGAGGRWANTEGGTRYVTGVESADRRRGQDTTAATQRYVVEQQQAGLDRRMAPEINPGNVVVVPPSSPLAGRADANGRIAGDQRPQTYEQARAAEVGPFVRGEGTPEEQDRRRAVVAPTVSAAEVRAGAPGRTPNVPVGAVRQIESAFSGSQTFRDGTTMVPDAESQRWLRARAGELWQTGPEGVRGNVEAAINEAFAEYEAARPPRTDAAWNPFGNRTSGLPQSLRSGTAAGSGASAPAQQPAAQRDGRDVVLPGGRAIREGQVVVQSGQRFIARGGRLVPATAQGQPTPPRGPGA